MPILRPEVQRLMQEALRTKNSPNNKKDIKDRLDDAGLSLEDTLNSMRQLRDFSDSENTKVRINESILKMHGALTPEAASLPSINIIIGDTSSQDNPILFPRELHKLRDSSMSMSEDN